MSKFKIKDNVEIEIEEIQQKIADRVGIYRTTLNKILKGNTTTNKAVAWYITYLNLRASNQEIKDEKIYDYFDEVE